MTTKSYGTSDKSANKGLNKSKAKSGSQSFFVVGIGAGIGGQEALHDFFEQLHDGLAAYLLIQHVQPWLLGIMPDLLSKYAHLPVMKATNGLLIEPGRIYLTSTNKDITIHNNTLYVSERHKVNNPLQLISASFTMLANVYGAKTAGILLSGMGNDGTESLVAIRDAESLAMVQSPATTRYNEMPAHAEAMGVTEHIKSPRELAQELEHYFSQTKNLLNNTPDIEDKNTLRTILELVEEQPAFDFTSYKLPTLYRRTVRRMALNKIPNMRTYLKFMHEHPDEVLMLLPAGARQRLGHKPETRRQKLVRIV